MQIDVISLIPIAGLTAVSFYTLGRHDSFRRHLDQTKQALDEAYRAGLERGRQDSVQGAFRTGFDFAMRMVIGVRRPHSFPLGLPIHPIKAVAKLQTEEAQS